MPQNITLPNGFVMTGVPDDATQSEIAEHAIDKGYATPEDFKEYDDIYRATVKPGKTGEALGVTSEMMANLNDYAQSTPVKIQHGVRELAGGLAIPEGAGLSTAARLATAAGLNSGASGITTAADNLTEGKDDSILLNMALGATAPYALHGAGKVLSPVFKKISPATSQYLKGLFTGADDAAGWGVREKGFKDAVPEAEEIIEEVAPGAGETAAAPGAGEIPEAGAGEAAAGKAANKTAAQLADKTAEQARWIHGFHQVAAHRMSAIEAESYLQSQLAKTETGGGSSIKDALRFYRHFINDYESDVIPDPRELRPEFKHVPFYEAVMRDDSPVIDKMLTAHEAGEEIDPQALHDALEVYKIGTRRDVMEWFNDKPIAFIDDLIKAEKLSPGITEFLDSRGALGLGNPQYVSEKLYNAHRAGMNDAADSLFKTFARDIVEERHLTSQEWMDARDSGQLNVVTALGHKLDALDQMQKNITIAEKEAKGIKPGKGEVWKELTPDQEAIYWGMINTHDAAERGAHVINQYRRMISLRNALPGRRAPNVMDKLDNNLTAATAGFMTGGPVGAIAAPLIKTGVEKAARTVKRKLIKNAVTRAIQQAAKE